MPGATYPSPASLGCTGVITSQNQEVKREEGRGERGGKGKKGEGKRGERDDEKDISRLQWHPWQHLLCGFQ